MTLQERFKTLSEGGRLQRVFWEGTYIQLVSNRLVFEDGTEVSDQVNRGLLDPDTEWEVFDERLRVI